MDLATDEICDLQCSDGCKHGGKLCRRWVPNFEARPEYVNMLEEDNRRSNERAKECWQLAWDCMSYIVEMKSKKLISKQAFARLKERADALEIYEKE